jgi:NADP-dependent 3-hydroxy acid dehydrogenase YdfG
MAQHLTGTVALVTGASSGIGAATALCLAADGAAVSLVARRRDRLEDLAGSIRGAGGRVHVVEADVSDKDQAYGAVSSTVEQLGRLDIVVNNAGVMLLGPALDAPIEEWEQMLALNVQGLMYVSHAALPHLLKAASSDPRGVADLVNVSSVAGRVARQGSGVYNATKHAVGAFSESLRQELTRRHVRVSLIEPGAVDTELMSHNRPEVQDELQSRFEGMERLRAEDVSDAISYIVTRARHIAVNELLIRPTEQQG